MFPDTQECLDDIGVIKSLGYFDNNTEHIFSLEWNSTHISWYLSFLSFSYPLLLNSDFRFVDCILVYQFPKSDQFKDSSDHFLALYTLVGGK